MSSVKNVGVHQSKSGAENQWSLLLRQERLNGPEGFAGHFRICRALGRKRMMLHALLKCGNVARSSSHAPLEECSSRATTCAELEIRLCFRAQIDNFTSLMN